jgi:DNA mismatch repair protein MutL
MTERRIRILSETTINQIAAGEVIENPASVVKELIENAIDAGATHILVETQAGGRGSIKVSDNGCGMSGDDLLLSVERHATSKLNDVTDLDALASLGFRGEALPSIASVSKMQLHSALQAGEGFQLEIEGGKMHQLRPLPRVRGTTIEVRSLFFNVPVRKKFQKSQAWDTGEIHKLMNRYALCYPAVSFSWFNDRQEILSFMQMGQQGEEERIKQILSEEFFARSFPVELKREHLSIKGRIGDPTLHLPNRTGQYLFINQRLINSNTLSNILSESYGTRLSANRYPLCVLRLTMPPAWIDVNVHPQKKEIRIREEQCLRDFILIALDQAFGRAEKKKDSIFLLPELETVPPMVLKESSIPYQGVSQQKSTLIEERVRVVAKVKNYFFIEEAGGIKVVDIARVLEVLLQASFLKKDGKQEVQSLLLPIQLTFSGKEKIILEESLGDLHAKGFGIRHFGGDTFLVDAIPALLEVDEIPDLIHAYLEEGKMPLVLGKYLKRKIFSIEMGVALLERFSQCPESHEAKKIFIQLDEKKIERLFS